ncbi:MAG: hypothetical protein ABIL01_32875 [Pseudomonadota bacterium]
MAQRGAAQRSNDPVLLPGKIPISFVVNGAETALKVAPFAN